MCKNLLYSKKVAQKNFCAHTAHKKLEGALGGDYLSNEFSMEPEHFKLAYERFINVYT